MVLLYGVALAALRLFLPGANAIITEGVALEVFQSLVNSELESLPSEDALSIYKDEQDKALLEQNDGRQPHLLCNSDVGLSGRARKRELMDIIMSDVLVVSNKKDMSCFAATISPEQHSSLASSPTAYSSQILTASMKVRKHTVDTIVNAYEADDEKAIGIIVCPATASLRRDTPGVGSISDGDHLEEIGKNIINDINALERGRKLRQRSTYSSENPSIEEESTYDGSLFWRNLMREATPERTFDLVKDCTSMFRDLDVSQFASDVIVYNFGTGQEDDNTSGSNRSCLLSLIAALSTHPDVCSIDALAPLHHHNSNVRWIVQSGIETVDIDQVPFWDAEITGDGQIVHVSDSGLDTDHCYFWDSSPGELKDGTFQPERRKVIAYDSYVDAVDENGHGTHVVGTVAGQKSVDGTTTGVVNGIADGVAKDAKIVFFDAGQGPGLGLSIPSPNRLFATARVAGAKIGNGSWGISGPGTYSTWSRSFDDYLYNHQDFLFLSSAGNDGDFDTLQTIGTPSTAKNCICVGASMNFNYSPGPGFLAYFSSRGPTENGHIKPDVVAPGSSVVSADADTTSVGECDNSLTPNLGTSMSSPVTAGSAALVRQYFEEGYYPTGSKQASDAMDPSAALVKAVLLNGAQDLTGIQFSLIQPESYDIHQGFGRVNLKQSLKLAGVNSFSNAVFDESIADGEDPHRYDFTIGDFCPGVNELSATLVWTDQPGFAGCTSGNCLINDLDLQVIKNGVPFFPNGLGGRDTVNSVERVRVSVEDGDSITVLVEFSQAVAASQSYGLAVTGCFGDLAPAPTFAPTASPGHTAELNTGFDGTRFSDGNMFEVDAKSDVQITGFDIHTQNTTLISALVFTRAGPYVTNNNDGLWELIQEVAVTGQGIRNPTRLPDFEESVIVGAGTKQSFYVTLVTGDMVYSIGSAERALFIDGDDLVFYEGIGMIHLFGEVFSPRVWNGVIRYALAPMSPAPPPTPPPSPTPTPPETTPPPTPPPSPTPTPPETTPTVSVKVVLQLDGVPSETGWSLQCDGVQLAEVPPGTYSRQANELVEETIPVVLGSECVFTIIDTYGDGICCAQGNGFYQLFIEDDLIGEGAEFGFQDQITFTVLSTEPPSPAPTRLPTAAPSRSPVAPPSSDPVPTAAPSRSPVAPPSSDPVLIQWEAPCGEYRIQRLDGNNWKTQHEVVVRCASSNQQFLGRRLKRAFSSFFTRGQRSDSNDDCTSPCVLY